MMQKRRAVGTGVVAFVAVAAVGLTTLASTRSDEEPTVIAAIAPATTSTLEVSTTVEETIPRTTSTEQPSTSARPTTSAAETTPSTTTSISEPNWDVEVLGPAMISAGDWVRLTDTPDDPNSECSQGWLGYLSDDGALHRYEKVGKVGAVRLFNGTRGQDAIAYSCEESVEAVLIQGSAILPSSGIPEWQNFELGEPYFLEYFSFLGWRGDTFMGLATTGTSDEFVAFDTANGMIVPAAGLIGQRLSALEHGYDFVLPSKWELTTLDGSVANVTIKAPSGDAWINISSLEFAGDPEPFENSELQYADSTDVPLWQVVNADDLTARRIANETDFVWVFDGPDGTQFIHHREAGELDLIIEYFLADSVSNSDVAVTHLAAELVRHYRIEP